MNLKKYLTTPLSRRLSNGVLTFLLVIAALGFADSTYLTIEHFQNKIPPCGITGCETVLTSEYAKIAGVIPVALTGALYYLAILVLLMIYLDTKREGALRLALFITFIGFLASLYFIFLQQFVIGAYCLYCLGSAVTSTALFVTSLYVLKTHRTYDI